MRTGGRADGEAVERPSARGIRPSRFAALVLALGLAITALAVGAEGASGLRIAVAPFEDARAEAEGDASVAQQLSKRFVQLGATRLLAPGTFVAEAGFDPRADQVRTWADRTAVDTVIVGRVVRARARAEIEQIEAVVRSGHSGAELFRHAVHVPSRDALGTALDQLAGAIMRDLGGRPARPAAEADGGTARPLGDAAPAKQALPPVAAGPEAEPAEQKPAERKPVAQAGASKSVQSRGGLETRLGVAQFDSDAPIEIKADQAEITARGEERVLVFQGKVLVQQGDVTLRSDRLEAEYADGESEPRRLVARGAVRVAQGNRSARCDRAEYLRATAQVTCRGHAELAQGCDVVRGELIVLDLAGDKARVEGAASIVISPKQNAGADCKRSAAGK